MGGGADVQYRNWSGITVYEDTVWDIHSICRGGGRYTDATTLESKTFLYRSGDCKTGASPLYVSISIARAMEEQHMACPWQYGVAANTNTGINEYTEKQKTDT